MSLSPQKRPHAFRRPEDLLPFISLTVLFLSLGGWGMGCARKDECYRDSDCPLGSHCSQGVCRKECAFDVDCPEPGEVCIQERGFCAEMDGAVPTDSGLSPDAALPDAAVADVAVMDAAVPDAAVMDAAVMDAAEPDAAVMDAAVMDAAGPDAATGDGSIDIDGGVTAYGPLAYENIPNVSILNDLRRVRWHPSGEFALVLGTGGMVVRYEAASQALSLYTTLGDGVADLDVASDGSYFLVVGQGSDAVGRLWRISVDPNGALTHTEEATLSFGAPVAIQASPDGAYWAIGSRANTSLSYLQIWEDGAGITNTKGFNAFGGLTDLMWGDPTLYAGSRNVILGCGYSGADSMTFIQDTDLVVDNNWPGSFGNAGGAGWRPGGGFGFITGQSSNKLYVFDGAWEMATLPNVGTAASPNAVGWSGDGTRALIVGRAIGPGLNVTVIDYRPGSATTFSETDLHYASILNFDQAPWFGTSSQHLQGVDFRPNTACTEGLIVGSDNGTSFSPTFGLLVRFYDSNDPDCP